MEILSVVAVLVAAAFFIFIMNRKRERELQETQQLLLQFIDQFEEQIQSLTSEVDNLKNQQTNANQLIVQESGTITNPIEPNLTVHDDPELTETIRFENRYDEILQLYHQGFSLEEIARKTGKGTGELRLILNLLKNQSLS